MSTPSPDAEIQEILRLVDNGTISLDEAKRNCPPFNIPKDGVIVTNNKVEWTQLMNYEFEHHDLDWLGIGPNPAPDISRTTSQALEHGDWFAVIPSHTNYLDYAIYEITRPAPNKGLNPGIIVARVVHPGISIRPKGAAYIIPRETVVNRFDCPEGAPLPVTNATKATLDPSGPFMAEDINTFWELKTGFVTFTDPLTAIRNMYCPHPRQFMVACVKYELGEGPSRCRICGRNLY